MSELAAAYKALCAGHAGPDLPPLLIQYADFAAWQRARLDGGALEAQVCPDHGTAFSFDCNEIALGRCWREGEPLMCTDHKDITRCRLHGAVAEAGITSYNP